MISEDQHLALKPGHVKGWILSCLVPLYPRIQVELYKAQLGRLRCNDVEAINKLVPPMGWGHPLNNWWDQPSRIMASKVENCMGLSLMFLAANNDNSNDDTVLCKYRYITIIGVYLLWKVDWYVLHATCIARDCWPCSSTIQPHIDHCKLSSAWLAMIITIQTHTPWLIYGFYWWNVVNNCSSKKDIFNHSYSLLRPWNFAT